MKRKIILLVSIIAGLAVISTSLVLILNHLKKEDNNNVSGQISFDAQQNINAEISATEVLGGVIEDSENKLKSVLINSETDVSSAVSTWKDLNISFNENNDDILLKLKVSNYSNEALKISIGHFEGEVVNAVTSIKITGEKDNVFTTLIDKYDTGNNGENIAEYKEIIITFKAINKNVEASVKNFNISIVLEEEILSDISIAFDDMGESLAEKNDNLCALKAQINNRTPIEMSDKENRNLINDTGYSVTFACGGENVTETENTHPSAGKGSEIIKYIITDQDNNRWELINYYNTNDGTDSEPITISITKDTTFTITREILGEVFYTINVQYSQDFINQLDSTSYAYPYDSKVHLGVFSSHNSNVQFMGFYHNLTSITLKGTKITFSPEYAISAQAPGQFIESPSAKPAPDLGLIISSITYTITDNKGNSYNLTCGYEDYGYESSSPVEINITEDTTFTITGVIET